MSRGIAAILIAAVMAASPARGATATYVVQDSALNKFASAVGTFGGNAGRYEFAIYTPCFPDFWNVCRTVLWSEDVLWTLTAPAFVTTGTGVRFAGVLNAKYGPFSYTTPVSGAVGVSYSGGALALSVNQIRVPITIVLPIFGSWTITTVTINPQYSFTYPLTTLVMTVPTTPTGYKDVHAAPTNINISYQPGAVQLMTEFAIW